MADVLLLGPVLFQDFEIPERVAWGGRQRMAVHHLPGGARVIDAMGRDDAPIAWSGVFSGADAGARARLVDLMRAEGETWPLVWGRFLYSVVVASFQVNYERADWMPYRIVCAVLRDEVEGVIEDAIALATQVAGDVSLAGGFGVDVSAASAALALPGAGTLGTASYGGALGAVGSAWSAADGAFRAGDAGVGMPLTDAASLTAAGAAAGAQARGAFARAYAGRGLVNLQNAGS
jgi:hypothetical protein